MKSVFSDLYASKRLLFDCRLGNIFHAHTMLGYFLKNYVKLLTLSFEVTYGVFSLVSYKKNMKY